MSRKVGEAVSVLEQDEAILCVLEFVGVVDVYSAVREIFRTS